MRASIRSTDTSRQITQVCPSRSTNLVSPAKSSSSTMSPAFLKPLSWQIGPMF